MSQPKGIERGCLARGISGLSNNITAAVTELHKAAKYASHANHAKNPANQRDDEAYEAYPHNCIGGQTYERYRTSLVQTFNRILPHLAATTPRQLSLIAWSMARLKLTPGSEHFLFAEMLRRASELDTQGISMVMWSFASLSEVTTEPLFNLLAFFASTKLQDMSSQSISNVLWSCAVLEKDSMPLMWAVQCRAVVSTVSSSASTQGAANIVWAMARLSRGGCLLQEEAARLAAQRAKELQPAEAAAVVWAVAVQSHSPCSKFDCS
eukprot:symbB.v1.2.028494.t1/scaffold3021.1/size65149/2